MTEELRATESEVQPMPAATLTALQASIVKWEKIANGTGVDGGCEDCALCQMFNREYLGTDEEPEDDHEGPWNCLGCPIATATNEDLCAGSPYQAYYANRKTEASARVMLHFLKSLLPRGVES